MKKVLFSLIGKTDPVSNYFDGSMLHICRYKRPDIVYLYISGEFLKYHRQDDRYRKTLMLLSEHIGQSFEIHIIERPELRDVHLFDTFYDEFEKELRNIFESHGNEIDLMINLSQGTPAMKSALQVVAAMANQTIHLIQVSSPEHGSNIHYDLPQEYSIQDYWEVDQDNGLQEEWKSAGKTERERLRNPDRTLLAKNISFHMHIQKEIIIQLIENYDYAAALLIAENIKNSLPREAFTLLKAAEYRISLKQQKYEPLVTDLGYNRLVSYTGKAGAIYEYALWLSIKQKRGDYTDFIRGMTPLLFALCKECLRIKMDIDIENYCTKDHGVLYLVKEKLDSDVKGRKLIRAIEESSQKIYSGKEFLASWQMVPVIQERLANHGIADDFRLLRDIEKLIRNEAAHSIFAVSDDDIKKLSGYSSLDIMDIFKRIIRFLGYSVEDEKWNSYDHLNNEIKQRLKL